MTVEVNADLLAMLLARNKVEKKYKAMGFTPYKQITSEFVGEVFVEDAQKDFEKHYNYFFSIIVENSKDWNNRYDEIEGPL